MEKMRFGSCKTKVTKDADKSKEKSEEKTR